MKTHRWLGVVLASMLTISLAGCKTSQPDNPPAAPPQASTVYEDRNHAEAAYDWGLTASPSLQIEKPLTLSLNIKQKGSGQPLGEVTNVHEKPAHLIIVSRDLAYFSHVHPEVLNNGQMQVQTQFPREGKYILYLQFTPVGGSEQTLSQTLQVGQDKINAAQLRPDADQPKTIDGYTFRLTEHPTLAGEAAMLTLNIDRNGNPLKNIEGYLGAGGHAVLLDQKGESFLHVHPMTEAKGQYYQSPIQFHAEIPESGLYKLWIQTQIEGVVKTVDFTFQVQPKQ